VPFCRREKVPVIQWERAGPTDHHSLARAKELSTLLAWRTALNAFTYVSEDLIVFQSHARDTDSAR